MPYNGVGQFTSLGAPIFPAVPNTFILASYFNSTMNDVFLGLSGVMTRDGQAPATANLPMAGFTLTGIASAVANGQPLAYGQSGAQLNALTIGALLTIPDAASVALVGDLTAAATSTADYTLGTVRVATQANGDSTTKAASTAFVADAITSLPGGSLPSLVDAAGAALIVNPDEATVSWEKREQWDLLGKSSTSMAISVATGKVFTVPSGKSWTAAMLLRVYYNSSNYMDCTVVSYAGTTLTLDCTAIIGTGTFTNWAIYPYPGVIFKRLPILSAAAFTLTAASSGETLGTLTPVTGLTNGHCNVTTNGSLLVCTPYANGSSANVATSPDGVTWTLRTHGLEATLCRTATDGVGFLTIQDSAAGVSYSATGASWSAVTSMPGGPTSPLTSLCSRVAGEYLVRGSATTTTLYKTINNGTAWTTETAPAASLNYAACVAGLYLLYAGSGATYYTSASGATGTWTARTFPGTGPNGYFGKRVTDGAVSCMTNTGTYTTVDGINWVLETAAISLTTIAARVGDGYVGGGTTSAGGPIKTWHNNSFTQRYCEGAFAPTFTFYANACAKLNNKIYIGNVGSERFTVFTPLTSLGSFE